MTFIESLNNVVINYDEYVKMINLDSLNIDVCVGKFYDLIESMAGGV